MAHARWQGNSWKAGLSWGSWASLPLLVDSGHLPFHVVSSHALSSWVAGLRAYDGLGVQKEHRWKLLALLKA